MFYYDYAFLWTFESPMVCFDFPNICSEFRHLTPVAPALLTFEFSLLRLARRTPTEREMADFNIEVIITSKIVELFTDATTGLRPPHSQSPVAIDLPRRGA